jgi:Phosphatidylglycerophosphate synthase
MERGRQWREQLLAPFLDVLVRYHVSADTITLLSLLSGLAFCPLFFWSKPLALIFLAGHVILDGIDGPLARRLGSASRRGSFTDTTCDQIVVTATTGTLMATNPPVLSVIPGVVYVSVYTIVVAFAMVRNAMNVPYSWLVRPRFFVYAWIPFALWLPGSMSYVVWIFNLVLIWKLVTGFRAIRRQL